ncbi:TonB-dependent siderophore receptor [Romeria aff. gracilis LEGE 07310]|uniref:TonB-dependent siderophore receptor n=1 Tax=Vasconcelosia minhoensis LEGE 07310 TaxID=915328 RepID=A0A8J7ABE9_9CYAN|nr:TonB-dependent siderophore receptor [Romeria aff. gracilis LEGE 07310]
MKTGSFGLMTVGLLTAILSPAVWANPPAPVMAAEPETGELLQPRPVPDGSELEPTAPTLDDWMAQAVAAEPAMITDVQVNSTPAGLSIILVSDQPLSAGASRIEGNALITEIPNVALNLTNEAAAEQLSPAEGIALVQVTSLPDGGVRLAITGTQTAPAITSSPVASGLAFAVAPNVADAAGVAEDAIQLQVTGDAADTGYRVPSAGVTRLETPLLETPASVQVIPRQLFEDRAASDLADALRTAVGVSQFTSSRDLFNNVLIRGFDVSSLALRNGIPETFFTLSPPRSLSNVERLEVLSGPDSIATGKISPGGVVNIVTKQPLSIPFYELSASYGRFNTVEGQVDLSGPLDAENRVRYRLNGSYEYSDTFIDTDDVNIQQATIAPVLSWDISDRTRLNLEGLYLNGEYPLIVGLPARGTILENPSGEIPRDQFLGEPNEDRNDRQIIQMGYDLEHRFSESWSLRHTFRYSNFQDEQIGAFPSALQDDLRTLERFGFLDIFDINNYQATAYATGEFETGSIDHRLVAGVDYVFEDSFYDFEEFEAETIDIFEPDFAGGLGASVGTGSFLNSNEGLGIYLQDQLRFWDDRLILSLGGRVDFVNSASEDRQVSDSQESQSDTAFSPRVGILFQPVDNISLYGSYSRSFQQVTGRSATNDLFSPSRGTQWEIGAKADWLDERLFTTLAFYDLTLSNVLTTDLDNPNFDTQTGEQRSRGVELLTQGEILPNWNVVASYAYTDAEVTVDNDIAVGNRLANVPRHSASLWTTYTIPEGSLAGLGFGLGLFYVGEREADLNNSFEVPSYFRTDAALFYRRDDFDLALNIKNLFDVNYVDSVDDALRVNLADPITFQLSASYRF